MCRDQKSKNWQKDLIIIRSCSIQSHTQNFDQMHRQSAVAVLYKVYEFVVMRVVAVVWDDDSRRRRRIQVRGSSAGQKRNQTFVFCLHRI